MASLLEFLVTFLKALAAAVGILVVGFLIFLVFARVSVRFQGRSRGTGQIASGAMLLLLGFLFLRSGRSALLYHTPIYFKGWMYPWQVIIGGSLYCVFGLFLVIQGIYRKKKPGRDS